MSLLSLKPTRSENEPKNFDPDSYRMTIGEHLEELRYRMILGIGGFFLVTIVCMCVKDPVMRFFLRPLMIALARNKLPPQVYYGEASESFMVYIQVSLIVAAAIASPWLLYQLWQFVAAGLYPRERKYITKYLPLSITLLVSGMVLLYTLVLPLMMEFFLSFNFGPAFAVSPAEKDPAAFGQSAIVVPQLHGDPPAPVDGQVWFDLTQERLKIKVGGDVRAIYFGSEAVASPHITLAPYIDMVVKMLLSFGVAFQLPLAVLALVRIGIVEIDQLKRFRRVVYFVITVMSGFIVPDVVSGMVALMLPMVILFELGLWLAARKPPEEPDDVLD